MPNPGFSNQEPVKPSEQEGGSSRLKKLWAEALATFYRDDDEGAQGLFLEVLASNPDNLRCSFLAALCACNLNDEETLEGVCAAVRRKNSRHPYAVGCEAVRALYYANYQRSEHLFQCALRSLPDDIDLNLGLGILYEQMGSEEKSAEVYRRVLDLAPDNIRARISLGISYALSGEFRNALAEYQYAKRLDPNLENPHQHLGRDLYAEALFEEAAQEFAYAIAEEPGQPAAYFYLMDCYKRLSRFDDALDVYEMVKIRFHHQEETLISFYEQFLMFAEATPILEKLLKETPDDPELILRLSQAYQQTGRIDQAIALLKRAVRTLPESAPLWSDLARLYYQEHHYQQAIAAAQEAVNLNRYDQDSYGILADALLFLGRIDEAQAVAREMELARDEAWQRYQERFADDDEDEDRLGS
ncbi:MAG: tetratricopeptide repeat protein [bacterium]